MREWLFDMRKEDGLTISDMAAKLGISEGYYCRIEHGQRKKSLGVDFCIKLANALGNDWADVMRKEMQYVGSNQ